MTYENWPMRNGICHFSLANSHLSFSLGYEIMTFRGCCELSSRNDFLFSRSFSVGCTLPVASVTRDTSVCSPGAAPLHMYVNSFQEYLLFVAESSVAACQGPSSTCTSTDLIGVPSFS